MATPPLRFTGMDERNTPKSEQLRGRRLSCGDLCSVLDFSRQ